MINKNLSESTSIVKCFVPYACIFYLDLEPRAVCCTYLHTQKWIRADLQCCLLCKLQLPEADLYATLAVGDEEEVVLHIPRDLVHFELELLLSLHLEEQCF